MTLLEMTVVIIVLLTLITVMFFGVQAWKRGSDRAICIVHIQNVQKGVRSYANLYGLEEGSNVPNLKNEVIGLGKFIEAPPVCPSKGTYTYGATFGSETIPPLGGLYTECSLKTVDEHEPPEHSDW
jgi:competence protein ComGC